MYFKKTINFNYIIYVYNIYSCFKIKFFEKDINIDKNNILFYKSFHAYLNNDSSINFWFFL